MMTSYSEWMREAPADAPAMTWAEWSAFSLELDRENAATEPHDPGHDASPGFCALCDEPPDACAGPLVDTPYGPMHQACADSEPDADPYGAEGLP
jgi:hypothetical protein